ncbi:hypothetical protein FRC10_001290, partial [Ceratobasidium sp. 414]
FFPIDQLQEHNNADIHDYGPPAQSASWDLYGKVSPVIPFFSDVVDFINNEVSGISHSHIHKNPKHEKDIQALITAHKKFKIHETIPARKVLESKDKPKDCMKAGVLALRNGNILEKRKVYFHAVSDVQEFPPTGVTSTQTSDKMLSIVLEPHMEQKQTPQDAFVAEDDS